MLRALSEDMNISFSNNDRTNEFVITINRLRGNQVCENSNQVNGKSNQVDEKSNQVSKESNQVNDNLDTELRYSDTKRIKLTNKQKDIVNFCTVPRTAEEIMNRIGISNQSKNRKQNITPLVEAGYLEMTNPEHPNASNQKYRRSKK